jgi:hypothetical protein
MPQTRWWLVSAVVVTIALALTAVGGGPATAARRDRPRRLTTAM